MATDRANVAVSRANNFTAQTESSKYRFPRPCLVAAIIFPHTKWLPKITDYRDTAALTQYIFYQDCNYLILCTRQNGHRDKFRCYRRFHDQGRSSGNFENLVQIFEVV